MENSQGFSLAIPKECKLTVRGFLRKQDTDRYRFLLTGNKGNQILGEDFIPW